MNPWKYIHASCLTGTHVNKRIRFKTDSGAQIETEALEISHRAQTVQIVTRDFTGVGQQVLVFTIRSVSEVGVLDK